MFNKDLLFRGFGFLVWGEIIFFKMELSLVVIYLDFMESQIMWLMVVQKYVLIIKRYGVDLIALVELSVRVFGENESFLDVYNFFFYEQEVFL